MAFNLQTFRTRTISAIAFAAIMLVGLLWNGWSFLFLFIVIHFGCWYEFVSLIKKISPLNYLYKLPLGLLYITLPVVLILNLGIISNLFMTIPLGSTGDFHYFNVIPCGIIFSIWINDTMAYIVGSFFGKTPFSKISPKKTWEGTIGGVILCVVVITWIGYLANMFTVIDWICISSLSAIFGTAGDLLESKLKRMAGVKDSGNIMPGHGGFLDRFDSFLLATPFVWLYIYFIS